MSSISYSYFGLSGKDVEKVFNESIQLKQFGMKLDFTKEEILVIVDPIQEFHRGGVGTNAMNGSTIGAGFDLGIGLSLYLTDIKANIGSGVARLEIKYHKPVNGNSAIFKCKVDSVKKNIIYSSGILVDDKNQICASCKGTLVVK